MLQAVYFNSLSHIIRYEDDLIQICQQGGRFHSTEAIFDSLFSIPEIGLISIQDPPRSGIVHIRHRNSDIRFRLYPRSAILCKNGNPILNSEAYFDAIRRIISSHHALSEDQVKKVFCFNGADLIVVKSISRERIESFISQAAWRDLVDSPDDHHDGLFKENIQHIQAYFSIQYLSSLPVFDADQDGERVRLRRHLQHFYDSFLHEISIEVEKRRELITEQNLKSCYRDFEQLFKNDADQYFSKIAPFWTLKNVFDYKHIDESLVIFERSGHEIARVPAEIVRNSFESIESYLNSHALASPEVFYDQIQFIIPKVKRRKLGSHFVYDSLSLFAQYVVSENIRNLADYQVLDPAADQGSLLLGLIAKDVLGTEKDESKYILMDQRGVRHLEEGVDFLRTTPEDYLKKIERSFVKDVIGNPLLVFTHPPFFGNATRMDLEPSLQAEIEKYEIKARDLYVYFMIQICRVFEQVSDGYVCVFTPTTWIQDDRGDQQEFRDYLLSRFHYEVGYILDGNRFFADMHQPVLFSVLKRKKDQSQIAGLHVDRRRVHDLTEHYQKICHLVEAWKTIPAIARFGFNDQMMQVSEYTLRRISKLREEVFIHQKTHESVSLVEWARDLPRFSKVLSASHSHSGNNELALSNQLIRKDEDVKMAIQDFKTKLHLDSLSDEAIASRLRLVYDDRNIIQTGYRFLYSDSEKFPSQHVVSQDSPVINYFEEFRKSYPRAKFYNAPPIMTDIAVARLGDCIQTLAEVEEQARQAAKVREVNSIACVGFKRLTLGSMEHQYLKEFESLTGDLRSVHFLRCYINELKSFKEVTKNKAIHSSLVWMPELRDDRKALLEVIALSFAYALVTTPFDSFHVQFAGHRWSVKDYFEPYGWLLQSGLASSLYISLMPRVSPTVRKACRSAIEARRVKASFDPSELIRLGQDRFVDAGFLPVGDVIEMGGSRKVA